MQHQQKERFGHSSRKDRKEAGATYTPLRLAAAVARTMTAQHEGRHASSLHILDPGCGDGMLTAALLAQLGPRARDIAHVTCIDQDETAIAAARARLSKAHPEVRFDFRQADFMEFARQSLEAGDRFDLVIANPPYIRIQALTQRLRAELRDRYDLGGRTDLSYAFVLAISELLAPGGRAGVIVSNRVLSTEASKPLRQKLLERVHVREVWDLGDSKLFEAAVLPAVLFFEQPGDRQARLPEPVMTSLYEAPFSPSAVLVDDLCNDLALAGLKRLPCGRTFEQKRGALETDGPWRLSSEATLAWTSQVKASTWKRFGDVARISVGIKSTADKVFIAKHWAEPRPELLRPLITHHVAGRYRASAPPDREVLYTHELRDGRRRPVDLDLFPASRSWLERHRAQLEGRGYVAKSGREWFEIWVPHSPENWDHPKIVFRDISERPTFWLDESGAVVNGDCYWMQLPGDVDPSLAWLMLAVANSRFIERFYDIQFNERLYAGRRRFMTRHVRDFPIPNPDHPQAQAAARDARSLARGDTPPGRVSEIEARIDRAVEAAFGL